MRVITFLIIALVPYYCMGQNNNFDNQNLKEYIAFRAKHDRYSGVTSIYKNNDRVFQHSEGIATLSWDIPVNADTKFNLASVTKMFTATAVGILFDQKAIQLNKTISTYFNDFPNKEIGNKVTIKQLLSHTSGISDFFFQDSYIQSDKSRLRNLKDYDLFLNDLNIGSIPEGQILYSNTNYVILGRIIEKITGLSFYEFCDQEIFEKAGMLNTAFFENDKPVKNLAVGYYKNDPQASTEFGVPNDGQVRSNIFIKSIKGMPAGGAYSTTSDLNKFLIALKEGQLITKETYELFTTPVNGGYALGFQVYEYNGIKVIGHSGGFYGTSTMVFHLPEYDYNFISLTNCSFGAQPVFDRFINLLNGESTYQPISVNSDVISQFAGYYEVYEGDMKGRQIEIIANENKLIFDKSFGLEFFPIANNKFFDIDNDFFTIEFKRNDGKISEFIRTDNRGYIQKARAIDPSEISSLQRLNIADDILSQYTGSFQFQEGGMMPGHKPDIQVKNGALFIDNAMKFFPYEKDKFFMADDKGMRLHFQRDNKGNISGIQVLREDQVVGKVKKLN